MRPMKMGTVENQLESLERKKFSKAQWFGLLWTSGGGNWGVGANYNYGDEQITHLLPGSSGSSGMNLQGSGAGGGALLIEADGDLIISEGVVIRAQGGDGRTNGSQWNHGGGDRGSHPP